MTAPRRRGTILIVAMIIIFAIAALVLTLGQAMRVEAIVAANNVASREAAAAAHGGEQYVLAMLAESYEPVELLDQSYFEAVSVGTGYVWFLRPDWGDPLMPSFGLVDESSRLDLNSLDYERLRLLPGLTDERAAAIVDWRDEDETPTDGIGAESPVYFARPEGHAAKNLPFETVEELLIVEGFTRQLLHGDGTAPPLGQQAGLASGGAVGNDTYRPRGWFDLFTVWSGEAGTSLDTGEDRLNVNDQEGRDALRSLLIEVFGEARGGEFGSRIPATNFEDIFDFALRLQMEPAELAEIEDRITVLNAQTITFQGGEGGGQVVITMVSGASGKLNVNWAPREALLTLPNMDEADVEALISRRSTENQINPHSIAWVLDVLGTRAIGLGRHITGRGAYYSADILAAAGNGRAFRRVRIVVDTSGDYGPQIVYRRDLTEQGWPLDPAILESLRAGQGPQQIGGTIRLR